jgi:hypothetical protein
MRFAFALAYLCLAPIAASALVLFNLTPCHAEDSYFVAIFAAQRMPNIPKYSHSFATFVRVVSDPARPTSCCVESHTISWLPETLDIHVARVRPETGRNLDLQTTLKAVESMGDRVSLWGPYRIRQELYDRALVQIARLESGVVRYKAVDAFYRTSNASNCIHALSDLADDRGRLRISSPGFGEVASFYITRRYEPWIIDPEQAHPWVGDLLGLEQHAIIPRAWDDVPRLFLRCGFPEGH